MTVIAVIAAIAGGPVPAVVPPGRHYRATCTGACKRRVKARMIRERRQEVVRPYESWITSTAACESGGNWSINTGNGFYGGMQFTLSSWDAVGGEGYPHQASALEQKYRAVRLRAIQGTGAWPNCGQ